MNVQFLNFGRIAENVLSSNSDRNQIIAATVATVISRTLSLPSSPLPPEKLDEYYLMSHFQSVANCVSDVNEGVIFDTRFALDLVRKFWRARVAACHPEGMITVSGGFFAGFFSIGAVLSYEDIAFLETNRDIIAALGNVLAGQCIEYFKPTGA